jgi:hypothetical protein
MPTPTTTPNTACSCVRGHCCAAYHRIHASGLLLPELRAFAAEHPDARAYRRHLPDGTPVAEMVQTRTITYEAGPVPVAGRLS